MKIETENGDIILREVFNPVTLLTKGEARISLCMRDEGFEIYFGGNAYVTTEDGKIFKLEKV